MAITFKRKQKKRKRKLGFMARSSTKGGRSILKRRQKKGRKRISA